MGRIIDYQFKSYVLNNHSDLLAYYRKCSRYDYINAQLYENGVILKMPKSDKPLTSLLDFQIDCENQGLYKVFRECKRINNANFHRTKRLKSRINAIITANDSTFLTLTFSDKVLSETSAETRRKYVARFLKSCNAPYVANIDFGSKNHREHYHAVIGSQSIPLKAWEYGANKALKIIVKNTSALSKYVCKLSNHAIKETTKRSSLMYSRSA